MTRRLRFGLTRRRCLSAGGAVPLIARGLAPRSRGRGVGHRHQRLHRPQRKVGLRAQDVRIVPVSGSSGGVTPAIYRATAAPTCRRTFNGLTGTPLAHLRKKERWEAQTEALIIGESVTKAAKRCGVAGSTAFRWRHRFLAAAAFDKPARLSGIVEADETFILESFKGKRSDLPRAARKRGGQAAKRGLSAEQIPILRPRPQRCH